MRPQLAPRDVRLAEIAARQHGVVAVSQLRALGFDSCAVARRVRAGRLHRLHRGVYAVGHAGITVEGGWMAAVLACGVGAVLSHGSAAALWGLLRPMAGPVHVTVPTHSGRGKRAGIRLHRCASLAVVKDPASAASADDADARLGSARNPPPVSVRRRIPVTNVARTIDDIRSSLPPRLVRRAIRQAQVAGFSLGAGVVGDRTRSDFEGCFLGICRAAGVPPPRVNVKVGRWTVDFLWPARRLAVETDSYKFHRGSVAFEDDHARDLDLRARGYEVRRFTEHQVYEEAERVAADLRAAFARGA
jgi:hypothetical protein